MARQRESFLFGIVNPAGKFSKFMESAMEWIAANPAVAGIAIIFACLAVWAASTKGVSTYRSLAFERMSGREERITFAMKQLQKRYFVMHAMDSREYRQEFKELQGRSLALRQQKDALARKMENAGKNPKKNTELPLQSKP